MCFQTAEDFDVQLHSNVRRRAKFEAGIYFRTSRENIAHFSPVYGVTLCDYHCDNITTFFGSLVSNWTVALNTWNTTREYEDAIRREDTA